jgi:hypothetical protein
MLTFPAILKPTAGGYAPRVKSISGGQAFGGFEQVVSTVNDRWQASFNFPLNRKDRILSLRAFVLGMRGRSNTVALPAFDLNRTPFAVSAGVPIGTVYAATFFEDWPRLVETVYRYGPRVDIAGNATVTSANSLRLNMSSGVPLAGMVIDCAGSKQKITVVQSAGGSLYDVWVTPGFAVAPGIRTAPTAMLTADATAGDRSVSIAMTAGIAPVAGNLFSIVTRLYAITGISGAGPYACEIWPSLRENVSASAAVEFAAPVCEMRFASDGEGADALKAMDLLRFGSVTLNFDETPPSTAPGRELREDGSFELREVD